MRFCREIVKKKTTKLPVSIFSMIVLGIYAQRVKENPDAYDRVREALARLDTEI